ncbi:MAG: formylmethanofuran dehydrogenase subunit C [Nitrospinota bacterium]
MDEIILTFKGTGKSTVPLEADPINPDLLQLKFRPEIERLPLHHGNEQVLLGDFFSVEGERSNQIRLRGDLSPVKNIGVGMQGGRIVIEGNVGMHVGARMEGGEIEVHGNADDWAGAEMTGGLLGIKGNAGNRAGSAYRGSKYGMRGGVILIGGSAGHEVGGYMRRGLIVVRGDVEDLTGARMVAGSIFGLGRVGQRTGGGMKRGSIVCYHSVDMLPTFRLTSTYTPTFIPIYLRALHARGFPVAEVQRARNFTRYCGDLAELGKGEILVCQG